MIAIINYGSGNVRAIGNIYDRLRIPYIIANTTKDIDSSVHKLILPGVGAFDETMSTLLKSGFRNQLDELVKEKKMPVLGICVGMQILAEGSEEGVLPGLGWIPGYVKRFDADLLVLKPKLPHLGWNSIEIQKSSPLLDTIDTELGFYFIHSYYFECMNTTDILTTTHYGIDFTSSVHRENIYGTQFHPEKSHSNGVQLLKNFAGF
jgi:imidazole glycerol-phosphate synthase subunit HisH